MSNTTTTKATIKTLAIIAIAGMILVGGLWAIGRIISLSSWEAGMIFGIVLGAVGTLIAIFVFSLAWSAKRGDEGLARANPEAWEPYIDQAGLSRDRINRGQNAKAQRAETADD